MLIAAGAIWFLFVPGATDPRWRRLGVPFAITALVFLVLSAGEFSRFAPAALLKHVPFFSSFRIPSRYTVMVSLFGALTAAMFARALLDRIAWTTMVRVIVGVVCVIGTLQLLIVNRTHFRNKFSAPPLESGFRVMKGTGQLVRDVFVNPYVANAPMLHALMNDQVVMWCYEVLQLKRGADDVRPLVWTDGPAKVSDVAFTPNVVSFSAIGGPERTRVFLNQNFAEGWRSNAGPVRLDPQAGGRLFVELAPGQTGRYSFSFFPPGLWTGVGILITAIAVSVATWNRRLPL